MAAAHVWTQAQSALFDRKVSDLVKDPGNPLRVYAAVPSVGVFVSNDEGQAWTAVNNAGLENVANAKRIVLNISPTPDGANHPLYVALIGDTQTLTANAAANCSSRCLRTRSSMEATAEPSPTMTRCRSGARDSTASTMTATA